MSDVVTQDGEAGLGVGAVELLVDVLSQSQSRSPTGAAPTDFYDRLCEAVCRLARMRRAVIFQYDAGTRRVRAVGVHAISMAPFADAQLSFDSLPITARALAEDAVLEVVGDLTGQASEEFAELVSEPARLVCAPMAAAGRALGVILADRPMSAPPLQDAARSLLWTLGKVAALVSVARTVSTQSERARALEQRIDLAREIHEGVIQRLFGVSMALDGDGDLPESARQRCATETQSALAELRSALQRPLGRAPRATQTTLVAEITRLARLHPALGLELDPEAGGPPIQVPAALEPLAQSVLREAVRNAVKHAEPSHVSVHVGHADGAFSMEVINDGVAPDARRLAGMGLRLATVEALQFNGFVEFGEREPGTWQVRLVVPDEDGDD
jgi:signal transduction histidine kinase